MADRSAHRSARAVRRRRRRALTAALAWSAIGLLAAVGISSMFGGPVRFVVVRGDSMSPTYASGDLLVVEAFSTPHVGDVISYPIEAGDGEAHVVHRATGGDTSGFVTRGDNRTTDDPWHPTADEIDGRVLWHVPRMGRLLTGWILPLFAAALASVALAWAIWIEPEPAPALSRIVVTELDEVGRQDAA